MNGEGNMLAMTAVQHALDSDRKQPETAERTPTAFCATLSTRLGDNTHELLDITPVVVAAFLKTSQKMTNQQHDFTPDAFDACLYAELLLPEHALSSAPKARMGIQLDCNARILRLTLAHALSSSERRFDCRMSSQFNRQESLLIQFRRRAAHHGNETRMGKPFQSWTVSSQARTGMRSQSRRRVAGNSLSNGKMAAPTGRT
jgi:hypothetical protein